MESMHRRDFAVSLSSLLALVTLDSAHAHAAQTKEKPADAVQPSVSSTRLQSAVFKPGPPYGTLSKRISHRYVAGSLETGHIRLGMHQTTQDVGAPHEPPDTQKHNEIYLVQQGTASVLLNGIEHTLEAGDVALICAGDTHWVKNIGTDQLTYFVVTLGPNE